MYRGEDFFEQEHKRCRAMKAGEGGAHTAGYEQISVEVPDNNRRGNMMGNGNNNNIWAAYGVEAENASGTWETWSSIYYG